MLNFKGLLIFCLLFSLVLAVEDSELVFTFMIHRHGERTPSQNKMIYSTDQEKLEKLVKPYGYGQLTEVGMRSSYDLGKYIRSQYNSLLGPKFSESEIYLRSTDISRTKMTMLVALAGLYPPQANNWSPDINWTPVPYTTEPIEEDFNRAKKNCKNLRKKLKEMNKNTYKEMEKYNKVLEMISKETEAGDLVARPLLVSEAYNVFKFQIALGLNLTSDLQEALPTIKEAADTAFDIIYSTDDVSSLFAGVLLTEFFNAANSVTNGYPGSFQRVKIYSAHHQNVYAFSKITNTNIGGITDFTESYALNLRQEKGTGKFIVQPINALPVNGKYIHKELPVNGCGDPCYYDQFVELTQKNAWTYSQWKNKCDQIRNL